MAVSFDHSSINTAHFYTVLPSLPQKLTLTWETLITCVKNTYLENDHIKSTFDQAQPLKTCYVNLAIVEEKEQQEKAKKLANEEVNKEPQNNVSNAISREAWLHSYEELHGVKRNILPADIFIGDHHQELKRLLLLGRAGIGKSVLCQYLAYQWANKMLWQDASFSLVIWVPLRQLANDYLYPKGGKALTLGKVVYELIKEQLRIYDSAVTEEQWVSRLDELLLSQSTNVLYVLDGYDEVACLLNEAKQSRQAEIIRILLSQERVLITSRPYYIDHYLSSNGIKIERRLENIGFVEENIHDYIQRYSWEEAEQGSTLSDALDQNSNLRGIAHIPINLALLCHHWRRLEKNKRASFNPTMTQLYEALIADLLFEHCGQPKGPVDFTDESGSLLFDNEAIQSLLWFLEKLAFLQMQDKSLIITHDRITGLLKEGKQRYPDKWRGFKDVLDAGLLVSSDGKEKHFEERREQYFIHLTFQEFFAARFLARVFKEEQAEKQSVALLERSKHGETLRPQPLQEFMAMHKYDLRYEIVWWFIAGLLKEKEAALERFFDELLAEPRDNLEYFEPLLWIKCLEECALKTRRKKALITNIRKKTEHFLNDKVYWYYSSGYKILWWNYLCSSPHVWEATGILKDSAALMMASRLFQQYPNLSPALLNRYANLLQETNKQGREAAQAILIRQEILPSKVSQQLLQWLENLDSEAKRTIMNSVPKYSKLSLVVKKWVMVQWKKQGAAVLANMRGAAALAYIRGMILIFSGTPLPAELTQWMKALLKEGDDQVRINVLILLSELSGCNNLTEEVLIEVMTLWEKETKEKIKKAAARVLSSQTLLFPSIFNRFKDLWQKSDKETQETLLALLCKCENLPEEIEMLLGEEIENIGWIGGWAQSILAQQAQIMPPFIGHLVALLDNPDFDVAGKALFSFKKNRNLPKKVLAKVITLWKKGVDKEMSQLAEHILKQQAVLPLGIALDLVSLLQSKESALKKGVKTILIHQLSLSIQVIELVLENMCASPGQWEERDKIRFLISHWKVILHHESLSLKLVSLSPLLLATILLNNASLGKGSLVHFKHSLFVTDGHQLKRIRSINASLALEVVEALKKLLSYKNKNLSPPYSDYSAPYQTGLEAEKRGAGKRGAPAYQEAIAHYTVAIYFCYHQDWGCGPLYLRRAWAKLLCGDYQGAIDDASQALPGATFGVLRLGYLTRAWAYLLSMQRAKALTNIELWLKYEENSGDVYCMLALILLHDNDLTKALAAARQAVALSEQGIAFFILAQLYRLKGEKMAYQSTLLKAQERGDDKHLFSLLEEWIMTVEKQLIKGNENTAQTDIIEKSEVISSPAPTFLPNYSLCLSSITSYQNNNAINKVEVPNEACEGIIDGVVSLTLKSSP